MYKVIFLESEGSKFKVSLDNTQTFLLYKSEVKRFNLSGDTVVEDNTYAEIMQLLYKRARERALYILDKYDKTEHQIREKLKKGLYPGDIIEKVVSYLKEYHMIDDLKYSVMYIECKENSKSRRQITQDLYLKGVSRDIIDTAFAESGYSDEKSLDNIIRQKIKKYNLNDRKELQKLYRYLLGKGYGYSEVKKALYSYVEVE